MGELLQMERERGRGDVQGLGDAPDGESCRARLHEQSEHGETRTLGEGGERDYSVCFFHVSMMMET